MPFTTDDYLPTYEEITVPELDLTSPVLRAGGIPFGKYCDDVCKEFMLCRTETGDPRKCINEGKEVTRCGFEFFGKVKKHCADEFTKYWTCIDHGSPDLNFEPCRKFQAVFDHCLKEKMNLERPPIGYFSMIRVHETDRPWVRKRIKFPDAIPDGPSDESKPVKLNEWPRYNVVD